jgi:hypothetical protein
MNQSIPYDIEVYFVQCSLSATTAPVMVDMENNNLRNPVPISQPSTTQWETYQLALESNTWLADTQGTAPNTETTWQAKVCLNYTHPNFVTFNINCLHKVGQILATLVNSGLEFKEYPTGNISNPSIVDELRLPFTAVLQ